MKLIVDSGSTKTDWIGVDENDSKMFETQTLGLNPQVLTNNIIKERVINNFELYQNRKKITHLYFYGAGCGTEPPRILIKKVFESIFSNASITIKEDTYAAVYACSEFGRKSIVSIIGTGSNCTYFDGEKIIQKVTSLGYILMDDASGYFFEKMPPSVSKEFYRKYRLEASEVKDSLYKKPNPNTYLAKFAKFMIENKDLNYCNKLITKGFSLFIKNQIEQFHDHKEIPLHFVGSIGFYLKDELEKVLKKNDLRLGKVLKRPIEGLVDYHQNNSNY